MTACRLATLALLTLLASCLHQHNTLIDYNETEYLQGLQQAESQLRSDLSKIKAQVQSARSKLSSPQTSDFQQIQTLQQSFAEQRDILSRIEGYLGLPFNLKPCVKTFNLTAYEKKDLNAQLDRIRQAINKFRSKADGYDCNKFEELKRELQREEQYVAAMEGIVNGECRKGPREFREDVAMGAVDLNVSVPVSNLGVANWVYGNITAQEYKYEMFALASKYNITKCKPQKPFAINRTDCIRCPKDKPIWNVGKRTCQPCADKTYFDEQQGKCKKGTAPIQQPVNSNRAALNFIGKRPIVNSKSQTCPTEQPYFDGQTCIICNYPLIFNYNTNKCEKCPQKTIYSYNLRKCSRPTRVALSSLQQAQNWITNQKWSKVFMDWSRKVKKEGLNLCPNNAPYYDEVTCVACELPKVFNLDEGLCMKVQQGFEFDENIHKVIRKSSIQYNTRPDGPYLLIQQGVTPPNSTHNLCPVSEPYFDGLTCINCQEPKIVFNLKLRICTKCSPGKIFDPVSKSCQEQSTRYMTNLKAQNIIVGEGKGLGQYEKEQRLQREGSLFQTELCPEEAPFYIKSNCVNCPPNIPYFDLEANNCVNCPAGHSFIASLHKCTKNTLITNTQAPNLVSSNPSALQSLISQLNNSSNLSSRIIQCPLRTPYFTGQSCTQCPAPHTLFNLDSKSCSSCPANTLYSPASRTCNKYTYGTSPKAPNLLYNGDFKKYEEQFERKLKSDEGFAGCPVDKTYWNGSTCVKCENQLLPLWDMNKKKCVKCKAGFNYSADNRKCLYGKVEVRPSIDKSFMNMG